MYCHLQSRLARAGILCLTALLSLFGGDPLLAQSGPPQITVQPQNQSVNSGSNAVFSVTATGTEPLRYQWRAEAGTSGVLTNIPRGTNVQLVVSNVNLLTARKYSVVVTNTLGAVTSVVAELNLDPELSFRILALRTNGYIAIEANNLIGDDRGGMAVSSNNVFLTGDATTGRWRKQDLTAGASAGQQYDALITDLRTEKAYTLAMATRHCATLVRLPDLLPRSLN